MHPIPCAHCGGNFMRQTLDPEAPKLCNNCAVREEKRSPTKKETMETIDILIKCPANIQHEIEEYCVTNGMNFTKYFLDLHANSKRNKEEHEEKGGKWKEEDEIKEAPKPTFQKSKKK